MLSQSLKRLEEIIEQETAALMARDYSGLEDFNRCKSQSLLEITRLIRAGGNLGQDSKLRQRIEDLRGKLEANHAVLERHMRAVREVEEIVSKAIQKANSDGTYGIPVTQMGSYA
ncbi:flagellar protein FlgN [Microvirga roseola]|uniref:flagellar protein FlgN n=1 Tax=Microvirga roseola TaxID=2883126 RepID=UPI001E4170AF|nr:flagellar protein FlgN [Microvirga roseola]